MRARLKLTGALIAAVMALGFVPVVASAQTRVIAYEVMEALQLKPAKGKHDPAAIARRFAEAALLGNIVVAVGPSAPFAGATNITATATSNVNLVAGAAAFGTGPIKADFDFSTYMDLDGNHRPNLSDLVIIASGSLKGTLDLRPALAAVPSPYALVAGEWHAKGVGGGPFVGVFLIPFEPWPGAGFEVYLNMPVVAGIDFDASICAGTLMNLGSSAAPVWVCPLTPAEHVLGFPLTKAIIVLQ
jgi:hypothetical protein